MSKLRYFSSIAEYVQEYPLAHELPYWSVDGDTVILADGSFVQGIALTGVDIATTDSTGINSLAVALRSFLNSLPDGIECTFLSSFSSDAAELIAQHASSVAMPAISSVTQLRAKLLNEQNDAQQLLNNHLRLFVYCRHQASPKKLGFFSSPTAFSQNTMLAHQEQLSKLSLCVDSIVQGIRSVGLQASPMNHSDVVSEIYRFLNPRRCEKTSAPTVNAAYQQQEFSQPELAIAPELALPTLREQLAFSDVVCDYDSLYYDGYYHRCITLKTLPEFTHSSMFSHFSTLDFPHTVALHLQVPEQSKELSRLQSSRRTAHSMAQSTDGRPTDMESEAKLNSTEELISELINTDQKIFYFQLAVLIRAKDRKELEARTNSTLAKFKELNGAEALVETVAGFKAWKTFLPFGTLCLVRPKRIKTDNLADFLPVYQNYGGPDTARPVCLFKSSSGSLIKYDPFDSSLPNYNALVTGSSGAGKSFVNNLILLQLLAHQPHVFIIDIGGSYRKLCEFVGGQYLEISPSDETPTPMNPFQLPPGQTVPTAKKIKFLIALVENILSDTDRPCLNKLSRSHLEKAIVEMYATAKSVPTFSALADKLACSPEPELVQFSKMLYPWTGSRPYGQLLDTTQTLDIKNSFVVFDLKGLSSHPDLQSAMILIITDYVLSLLENGQSMGKQIVIDECWELLKNPASQHFMEHCVRTLRKTGSGITFITQGLEEIVSSPIGSAILSNTATKVILQQRGDLSLVSKTLRLNDKESSLISSLQQLKGHYSEAFLVHNDARAVLRIEPTPLEYWIATSDPKDNAALHKARDANPNASLLEIVQQLADTYPTGMSGGNQ